MHGAFTWEGHRRKDGTLCLLSALMAKAPPHPNPANVRRAIDFIDEVEEMVRFRHPEAASIALMNALRLVRGE